MLSLLTMAAGVGLMVSTMLKPDMLEHPKGYVCYHTASPITIDGRLDKPVWQEVPWTEEFGDIEGDKKPHPRFRTRAKMRWDDHYLYIAAEMEEPHIWGTLTEHDSVIFQDNDFEVFIDPDGDNHEYYEVEINALNTEWDLRLVKPYRDGGPALNSWEIPGFKSAVHIDGTLNNPRDTDKGWSVEMALPWSVLKEYANRPSPPHDGHQWRINFSRVEWDVTIENGAYHKVPGRAEHNWVWSPQGVIDMHRPETWGYVQFSTTKVGSAAFQPDATLPARNLLMRIYYAQREFQRKHSHWASTLAELGFAAASLPPHLSAPEFKLTSEGYQASVRLTLPNKSRTLTIHQDSRLSEE